MATRTRSTQSQSTPTPEVSEPAPPAPETQPTTQPTTQPEGEPGTTTLDSHLDAPSVTAPGDGPADTTDPTERASSATPDKAAAAAAGHGTVNAVVKVGEGAVDPETQPTTQPTTQPEGEPGTTTLDSHLDAPSVTAPGDGPADTTDPTERASSATPDKAAAAAAGHGTVNAVVKVGEGAVDPLVSSGRTETYEATQPDGTKVNVVHDLDTGATRIQERAAGDDVDPANGQQA